MKSSEIGRNRMYKTMSRHIKKSTLTGVRNRSLTNQLFRPQLAALFVDLAAR